MSHPPPLQPYQTSPFLPPPPLPMLPPVSGHGGGSKSPNSDGHHTMSVQTNQVVSTSKRPIQACGECKRRKIKCNRVYPCGPCLLRGDEATCKEVEKVDPGQTYARVQELEIVSSRVETLEAQLLALQQTVQNLQRDDSADNDSADISIDHTPRSHTPQAERRRSAENSVNGLVAHPDEEVAMVLEDFAMGNRMNQERATKRLNPAGDIVGATAAATSPEGILGEARPISDNNPMAFFLPSGFDYVLRVVSVLPDAHRSWALVQFYFAKHEWYTKALHAPSFFQECEKLLSLPPYEAARQVRPEFLCTHLMVLCLALHLIEPDVQLQLGYTTQEAHDLAKLMFSAAQATLWTSDFLSSHSLEHLQCIVLMGVYQFNVDDQSDAGWALLGSAIKVAQNLGLSRLGPETESRKALWPEAWKSFRRREIGRRVWWNLIMLDWSHATAHSATYAAHPSQIHTAAPSNVNDNDLLVDSRDFITRSNNVYTESTFNIYRIRFVVLYRELVDHLNNTSPASYNFILNMDRRLVQLQDSLPPFFRDAPNLPDDPTKPNLLKESILLGIMAETRLLRLHRPYLTRGFRESKYAPSKDRCVQSARQILRLLGIAGERCPDLLRFWIVIFYSFTAAIVVFLDQTRSPTEETRTTLRNTLVLLKTAENVSAAARNAISLLEGLFAAEEEIANAPAVDGSGKRKRDSSGVKDVADPFQKVVNRLLLAASSPHHDASSASNPSPVSATSLGLFEAATPAHAGVFDFLQVNTNHPELDVFVGGGHDEGHAAGLGHLFSSDFGDLSSLLQDFESVQGVEMR